jgi:heterodisulfide reductase subunit A-like polyferredoxin
LTDVLVVDEAKCVGCGQCVLVCEFDAVEVQYGLSRVKSEDCAACGICIDYCPVAALGWRKK